MYSDPGLVTITGHEPRLLSQLGNHPLKIVEEGGEEGVHESAKRIEIVMSRQNQ